MNTIVKGEISECLIVQVAIAVPLDRLFDYQVPDNIDQETLKPGIRVLVPFHNSVKVGLLMAIQTHSTIAKDKLKSITEILDAQPLLSDKDLALWQWASQYYHHPLGEVLACALPTLLRQGKPAEIEVLAHFSLTSLGQQVTVEELKRSPKQQALLNLFQTVNSSLCINTLTEHKTALKIFLEKQWLYQHKPVNQLSKTVIKAPALLANPEQAHAIQAIIGRLGQFSVSLLLGVTGSGKTEVYMQAIAAELAQGLQVLVLLPEITLTPQLEQRFRNRFHVTIVSYHSKLTDKQRLNAWLHMQQGQAAIRLGTRSALFTPLKNPGLMILDEEHDSSFKQQDGFRFSARDVAISRAKMLDIPVVLGSATPSLESLFNAERHRYHLLNLRLRAGNAVEPEFQLLDIRNKKLQAGLSDNLITSIKQTLAHQEQVLLFLNRRGFAPTQICHGCGWVCRCQRCDANLVIHASEALLRCHHCGVEQKLLRQCPACKSASLQALGLGTERIEEALKSLFPDHQIVRLDKDSTQRKGKLEHYLHEINEGKVDIILGTQMLAKGHHFPKVTLVAIVDIDSSLFSIDYRAGEKLAQLIVQVAGRAGRAEKPGKVLLQTRQPQHPLLQTLLNNGYLAFAKTVLQERQLSALPPFSYQALVRVQAKQIEAPQAFLKALCQLINELNQGQTKILGPVAAPMLKRAGQYRFQMLLQSPRRQDLQRLLTTVLPEISKLKEAKAVRWSLDVDPVDLY